MPETSRGSAEGIPWAVLYVDRSGSVVDCSEAALDIANVKRTDVVGAPIDQLSWTRDALVWPLPDGRSLHVLPQNASTTNDALGVEHLARLATVGQLMASVVHEVNNALAGIIGYSQIAGEHAESDQMRRFVGLVHDEAQRTSRMLGNMLQLSRSETNERAPVSLQEVLQRCLKIKDRHFRTRGITVQSTLSPKLPKVLGDEALLCQVFLNLLNNAQAAIHSKRERGHISVRAHRRHDQAVIEIRDDGPGVPSELHDRVFERFFTTRHSVDGTGLGLPMSRQIARDHGGELQLIRSKQEGACFRVRLPALQEETPTAPPRTRRRPAPIRNRHIVVVEDEPSLRDFVGRAFAGHGNHLVTFERGEDALRYLQDEPVDLVVSDIHRTGMDGRDLYHTLTRIRPRYRGRFLFITGDTASDETRTFLQQIGCPFLRKPLSHEDLLRTAHKTLRAVRNPESELFANES